MTPHPDPVRGGQTAPSSLLGQLPPASAGGPFLARATAAAVEALHRLADEAAIAEAADPDAARAASALRRIAQAAIGQMRIHA